MFSNFIHVKAGASRTLMTAVLLCLLAGCSRSDGSGKVFKAVSGNPDMVEAIRQARDTLDTFLAAAAAPVAGAEDFKLKVAVQDGELTEHFWVTPFARSGDSFEGTLASDPAVLMRLKAGQRIRFTRDDVADWGYRKDGHQVGNYTMCAAFKTMPKADVDFYRNNSGFDC
jgi:uncharacterized protein YegJ (DUF2314 family)